jgi:hypothetical protein
MLAALRSTLRDGADRRHPSGAADLTVRLGLGSAWRGPPRHASLGRFRTRKVMNSIESVPVAPARVFKALCDPARPDGTRFESPESRQSEIRAATPSSGDAISALSRFVVR